MRLMEARCLSNNPTDAAVAFLAVTLPKVRAAIAAGDLPVCVIFDPADHTHRAWRTAAIQALAREAAPGRVNALAGIDAAAIKAGVAYLANAPGVTGQYLELAGDPVTTEALPLR